MKYLLKNPESKRKFIVFIGDVFLIAITIAATLFLFNFLKEHYTLKILMRPLKLYVLFPSVLVYLTVLYTFEMYEVRQRYGGLYIFTSMLLASSVSFLIMFALAKVLRINQTTMVYLFVFFNFSMFSLSSWRKVFIAVFSNSGYFVKRILFVGMDALTGEILKEIKASDYNVIGVITNEHSGHGSVKENLEIRGRYKDLNDIVVSEKVDILITAIGESFPLYIMKQIYKYKFEGIDVYDSAYFYEILTRKVLIKHYLESKRIPYINVDTFVNPVFKNIKRTIDFLGALFLFVLLLPLFLAICILIRITSGSPVFFLQERLGFQEEPFKLIKFRTMIPDAEKENGPQWANKEDNRVTKLGIFLRKTRLDELPQLINVLKGEMSFVGPRPIRRYFANLIEEKVPFYSLRFTVKPGLTGWAQVHYDYGGSIEGHIEKFQYDLYYIKYSSLFLDLFIFLKTLQTIIRRPAY